MFLGTVTYSISSGNIGSKFDIDTAKGDIILVDHLDFETLNTYTLVIKAVDKDAGTPLTGTTTLSLTVSDANDNLPSCTPMVHSLSFPESTTGGSSIVTLTCDDLDSGVNGQLEYSIVSINGNAAATSFQVDASGEVTTAATTTLDFESLTKSYRILIRVKDKGVVALSTTVTVNVDLSDVNENAPVFVSTPYATNVQETTAIGTSVYKVTATDADTSQSIRYSISPSNQYFEIDPTSGNLYTIDMIDFDTLGATTVTLTVVATDNGQPSQSSTATVTFTVINANDGIPVFNPGVYTASIPENTAATHTVLQLTVTDIDDTTFTYSIISGNGDNVFFVDTSGRLLLNNDANFDYDTQAQSYLLVVQAQDSGTNVATATVAIDVTSVNEAAPLLGVTDNTVTIAENSASGTSVDTVAATDTDSGPDGDITYRWAFNALTHIRVYVYIWSLKKSYMYCP